MHLRLEPIDTLLGRSALWHIARRTPWMFTAPSLHRAGLAALDGGQLELAGELFEHAALRYREDLRVMALARVRVHQRMAMARAAGPGARAERLCLEVEHALGHLDRIESPAAPFELVDAHTLLATWLHGGHAEDQERLAA